MSSTACESHAYSEESLQGASLHSKGIWEIPKATARSVQLLKKTKPIKTKSRFNPLEENAALETKRVVPCNLSQFSHAAVLYTNDEILSQGGVETNPKGIWQMPKPTAKNF